MAAGNFEHCLKLTLLFEGGYVDNRADPGGATNLGITLKTFAQAKGRPVSKADLLSLTKRDAAGIYRQMYWVPIQGDCLPLGLDAAVFDYAVNSGPRQAIKALQRVLGVPLSGKMDSATLGAIVPQNGPNLVLGLCRARMSFLERLKSFRTFKRGWSARVRQLEVASLAMQKTFV